MHLQKRPKAPVLPPVMEPVALATLPPPKNPPLLTAPVIEIPPMPISAAAATPRRERKHLAPKTATAAPAEEAAPEPPTDETAAIGDLTAGGAANPQAQEEAASLIRLIEKRVKALPPQTARKQRSQVNRVQNFERQAQDALKSGDVEGATTLATKANLLLDDLDKQTGKE
ncbi:hypothetical protein [Edaphobacter sp. DSM 109919]